MTPALRAALTRAKVAPWPVTTLFVISMVVSIVSALSLSLAVGERAARQDAFERQAGAFARYSADADLRLCLRLRDNRNELRDLVGGTTSMPLPVPAGADAALRSVIETANERSAAGRAEALAQPSLAPIDCSAEQRIVDGGRVPAEGAAE